VYAAYAFGAFMLQRTLIFVGKRRGPITGAPPSFPNAERVALETPAGRVDALYMAPRVPPSRGYKAPAVLFAHGNAELIDDFPEWFEVVRPPELAVLLVEYPGYGWSEGEPSAASARDTLELAYDWLVARPELDPARIVGYGRSLGGGALCTLVGRKRFAALVLSSTFTSLRPLARSMFAPPMLLEDPFDNLAAVKRFEGPVLVLHGTSDEVIPYPHGEELAAASPRAKLLSYRAGHNDCPPDPASYAEQLAAFLTDSGLLVR
jgi:fermentation-respiration switch protein FrsA (DUF1100 family)